jgi:hypothetical protein
MRGYFEPFGFGAIAFVNGVWILGFAPEVVTPSALPPPLPAMEVVLS